jgi:AcrR family transcriptional regulator
VRAAEVAPGLLYHYFDSKEALVADLLRERGFLPRLRELLTGADDRPAGEVLPELLDGFDRLLAELHRRIATLAPALHDRVDQLDDWDKIHQLTVRIDRLARWHRPGLLCIGDAARTPGTDAPRDALGALSAPRDALGAFIRGVTCRRLRSWCPGSGRSCGLRW